MSKYNLVRNGIFSGSGDHVFTWTELEALQDGTTTSGGVTVSGVNDLVIDLSQRIKVDGIRLYTSDLTKSADVYFYYKNTESADYILLSMSVGTYYYTSIQSPSAPRYIKVTISGVSMDLYEFQVFNDDYVVAFGTDGQHYAEYLENTPVGEEGIPQAIAIYNNSTDTIPAVAYTCVEATGSGHDNYIKISSSENGIYYAVEDGAIIEDNNLSSNYIWAMGEYDGTELDNDEVIISSLQDVLGVDMGDLPLAYRSYSWYVGQNCWDYDPVSRTIYAIGSDGALNLYKYPIDDQVWTYVGEINSGCSSFTDIASMSYLDGYVYVIIRTNGEFGRYDLSGSQNNWESLPSVGWAGVNPTRFGMCSDKNRYIYTIHQYYINDSYRQFRRYDTTTSGWTALSNAYSNNYYNDGNKHRRACLAYDYDKDEIYADVGSRYSGNYIQRYVVSSDIWNTTWFDVDTHTNAASDYNDHQTHSYYNGYLVLGHAQCGSRIYHLHIPTDTFSYFTSNVGGFYNPGPDTRYHSPYILVTDVPLGDKAENTIIPGATFWASQINIDRGNLYKFGSCDLSAGLYTTPIVGLDNKYNSSYVTIKHDGEVSVSDSGVDSIEVRSSDTAPIPIYESYLLYSEASDMHAVIWSPYDGSYIDREPWTYDRSITCCAMATDHKDGRYAMSWGYGWAHWSSSSIVRVYNRSGSQLYDYSTSTDYYALYNVQLFFEGEHGLWGYGNYDHANSRTLRHHDEDLSVIASYGESQQDFICEIATEIHDGGRGVWYTNKMDETLVHMNTSCTILQTILLDQPRCVASTMDGGVWVEEDSLNKVYRYDYSGNKIATFNIPEDAAYGGAGVSRMSHDFNNGFWYRHGDIIRHVTSNGVVDFGPIQIADPNRLRGTPIGCFVHSTDDNKMYWAGLNGDLKVRNMPGGEASIIGTFYYGHDEFVNYKQAYLPTSYDPIWGTTGSLEWKTVSKNGYFLPKCKYHQFRITLRDTSTEDAALKQVILAPAVKTEDIQSGQSKNLYIKTDIPIGADISEYEVKLRSWWGISD